jgi:hypothetical protein
METIQQIITRASERIKKIPGSDLKRIDYKLNCWTWDDQLGKKPDDWDTMPDWKNKKILWHNTYADDKKTRTKHKIISPLHELIESIPMMKEVYKKDYIYLCGYTEQQFSDAWDSELKSEAINALLR